jgi:protein-S-isoprenylcysteine O-methyltransferase Ste14
MTSTKATLILILQLATIGFVFSAPFVEFGSSNVSLTPPFLYLALGLALILFGAYLFLSSLFTMSSNFEIRAKQRNTAELVTQWPFSWVRNPIYLSGGFLCLGWSIFFQSKYALLGGITLMVILLIKIRYEEYFLKKQFGKDYSNYLKKVPRIWPANWRFKSKK